MFNPDTASAPFFLANFFCVLIYRYILPKQLSSVFGDFSQFFHKNHKAPKGSALLSVNFRNETTYDLDETPPELLADH